jgi:murein DD-endopeptidase MepM/ murein hydrolase activator NlpD
MESLKNILKEIRTKKYHLTLYTNDPNEPTKNINISKKTLLIYLAFFTGLVMIVLFFIFSMIPLGRMIKSSPDESKLKEIETKIKRVGSEIVVLQEYNNQLRYALGDTSVGHAANYQSMDSLLNSLGSGTEVNDERQNRVSVSHEVSSLDVIFSMPVSNYILSQEFDDGENHFGVDFAGKTGDPVFASADGVVVFSNYTIDYGNTLILVHGNKFLTKYKHNLANLKSVGSYVTRGEMIAMLGNTGRLSSSPHLHFEIWKNGVAKNPIKYLINRN